jgi:hypothetical protein
MGTDHRDDKAPKYTLLGHGKQRSEGFVARLRIARGLDAFPLVEEGRHRKDVDVISSDRY